LKFSSALVKWTSVSAVPCNIKIGTVTFFMLPGPV
jgi:hypothetical protein